MMVPLISIPLISAFWVTIRVKIANANKMYMERLGRLAYSHDLLGNNW